jgi:regulator of protease activity HflC (stomatin/prohibitin superfamily)
MPMEREMPLESVAPAVDTGDQRQEELRFAGIAGRRVLPAGVIALIAAGGLLAWVIRLQAGGTGQGGSGAGLWAAVAVLAVAGGLTLRGLTQVAPGEAVVVQLFGGYRGTIRDPGLTWVPPWATRHRIRVRIRNYETPVAKVNDADGNPVEVAVVIVWQVADTARAVFAVDDVAGFVAVQAEIAARQTVSCYPYDDHGTGKPCLRASTTEISAIMSADIAERVAAAGVRVLETRITRLSYAPEIAHSMLRRQQAEAVVAARQRIVDGAVGMVESALVRLSDDGIVQFDEERKAAMVSNMLVVLCSDHPTQPVINTGTIYQ